MGQESRYRLGILFNINRNWLGGVYYIINLIKSLNSLDEIDKPELIVFYSKALKDFIKDIDYPYVTFQPWKFKTPFIGYTSSWAFGRNHFSNEMVLKFDLDGLYPERHQPLPVNEAYDRNVKSVSMFLDLQHKYYPEFFSKKQLKLREFRLRLILRHATDLVVSSQATYNDFKKFYSLRSDLKIHVLNFVSIIDDFNFNPIESVRKKYGLPSNYYMISNQFHKHKNHEILLKALARLRSQGPSTHFAITGRMPSSQSSYLKSLNDLITSNHLEEHVSFLGVIPRKDQLSLMKNSLAVIQPSLFEGWSTVIEDAKSLQVPVIASNLDVNIEQLGEAGIYFDPHDENELANIITSYKLRNGYDIYKPYSERVKEFAEKFIHVFK